MKWLQNAWYAAMFSSDLAVGQVLPRTILNVRLALFRNPLGEVSVLEDRCPHRNAPLSAGRVVEDGRLRCGYHGLEFNESGACVFNPHGDGKIPSAARVRSFEAVERHTLIWVWMGSEPADVSKIPDLAIFDPAVSPYRLGKPDWIRMKAPWYLIVDNLLDLSHVSFLHDGLLGNESTIPAATDVTQTGDRVAVRRWMPDVEPPRMFDLMLRNDGARIDMWHDIEWQPPSVLILDVGAVAKDGGREQGTGNFAAHILTPETENSTLYLFMSARNNPLPRSQAEEEGLAQELAHLRRTAFAEQDAPMIVSQHETVEAFGGTMESVMLPIDAGVVRWRRVMTQLLAGNP